MRTAFEAEQRRWRTAVRAGRIEDARRILQRMSVLLDQLSSRGESKNGATKPKRTAATRRRSPVPTWVPASRLAHELQLDHRTLTRYVEDQPFVARIHPRLLLVERAAFETWWQTRCAAEAPAGRRRRPRTA